MLLSLNVGKYWRLSDQSVKYLSEATKLQTDSLLWFEHHKGRITASQFGTVLSDLVTFSVIFIAGSNFPEKGNAKGLLRCFLLRYGVKSTSRKLGKLMLVWFNTNM
jgi:hypothetical protein